MNQSKYLIYPLTMVDLSIYLCGCLPEAHVFFGGCGHDQLPEKTGLGSGREPDLVQQLSDLDGTVGIRHEDKGLANTETTQWECQGWFSLKSNRYSMIIHDNPS